MAAKKNQNKRTNASMQSYKRNLIIIFLSVVFLLDILLTTGISYYTGKTMNEKISLLLNANTYQQAMNVENYFTNIKDTASLFFSDEMYYAYDATKEMDEIERLQSENVILERIRSLGVLENFSDFGIIYANNNTIGWMSEGVFEMLSTEEMYDFFAEHITDENTQSGWFCTDKNNYDRMYYVKRLNKNAIIVASIFSRELESIFNIPQQLEGMEMRLINEDKTVLYSTEAGEIGGPLDPSIEKLVYSGSAASDKDNIVSSISFRVNDWRVICSVPESIVREGIAEVNMFAHLFSFAMRALLVLFGYLALNRASDPMSELVMRLSDKAEHDQLTGVLNKISFQTMVEAVLNSKDKKPAAFVMLDMDNFKTVNDTLGHKVGDEILVKFSALLERLYDKGALIGRMGGDEFAVFAVAEDDDIGQLKKNVSQHLELLKDEFIDEFREYNTSCGLSLSSGAYVDKNEDLKFDKMYKTADKALYQSKNTGKNTYTVV